MNETLEIIIDSKQNFCTWNPTTKNDDNYQLQNETKTVVSGKHAFFPLHSDSCNTINPMNTPVLFSTKEINDSYYKVANLTSTNNIKSWEEMINLV